MNTHGNSSPLFASVGFFALLVILLSFCKSSSTLSDQPLDNTIEQLNVDSAATDSARMAEEAKAKLRADLVDLYKDEVFAKYQAQANTLTNYYILAQQHFYSGDFENALFLINRASLIRENADVIALRGSIYLGLGYINEFVQHWKQALELDADVPIPNSPYLIRQLQNNGLIDENLKKAF